MVSERPLKRILMAMGIIFALPFVAGAISLWLIGQFGPERWVVPGDQIRKAYRERIRELGILQDDETILYFYSPALLRFENDFVLLTCRRIVVFNKHVQSQSRAVFFEEIEDLRFSGHPSILQDSELILILKNNEVINVKLSSEKDGDRVFLHYLQELMSPDGSLNDEESVSQ